jgi:hypothetical protein
MLQRTCISNISQTNLDTFQQGNELRTMLNLNRGLTHVETLAFAQVMAGIQRTLRQLMVGI